MISEIEQRADFSAIRYAQCWEDADVLLGGLDVKAGDTCLSIASAGENSLSLLTKNPSRVIAIDLNPSQLACLELRVAAFRRLDHPRLLELIGSRPAAPGDRLKYYALCRSDLSGPARGFWDAHQPAIEAGIGSAGKFERYFATFRNKVLPLVHRRKLTEQLLESRGRDARIEFHTNHWDSWRWRLMFRAFFSRFVMGKHGRDPSFFKYAEGGVAGQILKRTKHALTELDPSENPYLTWILTGTHREALPHALREEHFEKIRGNLDRIEWHLGSVEDLLAKESDLNIDRFNLSDIFEYMSEPHSAALMTRLVERANPGARLAYWNMLAPRACPDELPVIRLDTLSKQLHEQDRAFFYSRFIVEEVQAS